MNSVDTIISRLGITDSEASSKAMEYLRLLELKVPLGGLKKTECARPAIAVEFACRNLQVMYDRKKLFECAMVSSKDYNMAYTRCKNILQLDFRNCSVLDTLLVYTGYKSNIRVLAEKILEAYREKLPGKIGFSERNIDFKSDVYMAAAFKLACKMKRCPCDRKDVLSLCGLEASYFDRIYGSLSVYLILTNCFALLLNSD